MWRGDRNLPRRCPKRGRTTSCSVGFCAKTQAHQGNYRNDHNRGANHEKKRNLPRKRTAMRDAQSMHLRGEHAEGRSQQASGGGLCGHYRRQVVSRRLPPRWGLAAFPQPPPSFAERWRSGETCSRRSVAAPASSKDGPLRPRFADMCPLRRDTAAESHAGGPVRGQRGGGAGGRSTWIQQQSTPACTARIPTNQAQTLRRMQRAITAAYALHQFLQEHPA